MSDLLIILVVLGALIVVGVLAFNWWQEKKYKSRIANDFKPSKRDVLIEDFQLNTENLRQAQAKSAIKQKLEPSIDEFSQHGIAQRKEPVFEHSLSDLSDTSHEGTTATLEADTQLSVEDIALEDIEAFGGTSQYTQNEPATPDKEETTLDKTPAYVMEEVSMPSELHAQIDLIAFLYAAIPIAQAKVVGLETQFKEFSEHIFAFGLTTDDAWVLIDEAKPEQNFTQLAYSLQMADRGGPVTRATLNRFQHMVETIGLDLSAHVEWQGAGDPLNNAMSLDQFCIEVDKTVGFHLLANNGASFHATKLRGLVEAQGLQLGNDGRFHHLQTVKPHQLEFAIKNYEGNAFSAEMLKSSVMHGITFQLDIPTAKNSADVFDNMVQIAKHIAKSLDASIVDDNRKVLGDIQLEKIRQQLKVINATMIAKGIIPGSTHALRLFS
jgi:FtsZ-interacting cell division protein ZipA